jgi:hypothetical protein
MRSQLIRHRVVVCAPRNTLIPPRPTPSAHFALRQNPLFKTVCVVGLTPEVFVENDRVPLTACWREDEDSDAVGLLAGAMRKEWPARAGSTIQHGGLTGLVGASSIFVGPNAERKRRSVDRRRLMNCT